MSDTTKKNIDLYSYFFIFILFSLRGNAKSSSRYFVAPHSLHSVFTKRRNFYWHAKQRREEETVSR